MKRVSESRSILSLSSWVGWQIKQRNNENPETMTCRVNRHSIEEWLGLELEYDGFEIKPDRVGVGVGVGSAELGYSGSVN
ncbi:hypothetical protein L1987_65564 [Smallanthus sonchifolius]|uniref:Uncharacterized protein n=1 Tax=Smallanthus sonchifolius TaxID=185202 RepID=A0ACB9BUW2_9ASTR|nr:hypothetical protein L1987_65564 [Smallanthus sonchifolius]